MHFTTIVAYTNSQFNSIDSLKLLISLFTVIVTIISIVMVRKNLRITNNLSEKLNRDNILRDLHNESNWRTRLTEIASKNQNTLDDIEVLLTGITTMYQQDNHNEITLIDKNTGELKNADNDKDRMDVLLIEKCLEIKAKYKDQQHDTYMNFNESELLKRMARIKLKDDWEFQHTDKHLSPKTIKKILQNI